MTALRLTLIAIASILTTVPCNAQTLDVLERTSRTLTEGMPVRFGRELLPSEIANGASIAAERTNRLPILQRIFDWETASYSALVIPATPVGVGDAMTAHDARRTTPAALSLTGMVTAIALHWAPDDAMHRANRDFTRVFEDLVGIVPGSRVQIAPAVATARLQGMVPIPAAIWLFLTALLALPAWQRRVRKST